MIKEQRVRIKDCCWFIMICISFSYSFANAQSLRLKSRRADALTGTAFAKSISDTALTLEQREEIIFNEIKNGNVPDFLRKLKEIKINSGWEIGEIKISIAFYVLPDYFCIGSNDDFFYVPMTPILAQKVADLTKCSLPTKKMVDTIYHNATIKLLPQPIPPTKAMTTVAIFLAHNDSVKTQLKSDLQKHNNGELTAGHKKDLIISNKIYTEKTPKVVIYGWHKMDGRAIQPVYNKHTNLWVDYSHGLRLIQNKVFIYLKKNKINKVLTDKYLSSMLSDEGVIKKPFYPITTYKIY
ncbi:hypothetical protein EZ428_14820 [Pedobacter frigiditerrae]|uniref:Uncharacterized protein n=1 Tax=Pedobacter frigiditerrae TaxID=2530452 RepID=A0A4R0MU02_9SPHI|nr:hypothetical protein [Pedobacter frigiditerrae]TCC90540.1 hypothetical protein EZ428_14820 [Pedobacter frigiditerrae]